jgi:hypothetical protein
MKQNTATVFDCLAILLGLPQHHHNSKVFEENEGSQSWPLL